MIAMLSTRISEYLIGFRKFNWEYAETCPNFQVAKVAIFYCFLSFQGSSSEKQKKIFLTQATPPKPSR